MNSKDNLDNLADIFSDDWIFQFWNISGESKFRKQIEEIIHIRANEERDQTGIVEFDFLFDCINDAFLIVEMDTGKIIQVNQRAKNLLVCGGSRLIGAHLSVLFPATIGMSGQQMLQSYGELQPVHIQEFRCGDGTNCLLAMKAIEFPWRDTQVLLVSLRDVSLEKKISLELKQAKIFERGIRMKITALNEELAQEIAKNRQLKSRIKQMQESNYAILDKVHCAVIVCSEDGRFHFINRNAHRMFKEITPIDVPETFVDIIPDSAVSKVKRAIYHEKMNETIHLTNLSGRPVRWTVSFKKDDINVADTIDGMRYICTIEDETEAFVLGKKVECLHADIHKRSRFETMGVLAGGIAHDFNNMLLSIMGYTELIQEDLSKDSVLHEDIEQIIRATRRAREMVMHILNFNRNLHNEMQHINLSEIIEEALLIMKPLFHPRIRLKKEIQKYTGRILAEPFQIHQIVLNLCRNSVQAMQGKGQLVVALKKLDHQTRKKFKLNCKPGQELIWLRISDDGIGMDQSTWQRSIEPFLYESKKESGSGLGLSIVHRIVENLEGKITFESSPKNGTHISVYLPVEM